MKIFHRTENARKRKIKNMDEIVGYKNKNATNLEVYSRQDSINREMHKILDI